MDLLLNIRPENRTVLPGIVWILLLHFLTTIIEWTFNVGIFGYEYYSLLTIFRFVLMAFMAVFQFYVFVKIANSISKEYDSREIYYEYKPTFMAAIWLSISYAAIAILNYFGIFYLSIFASIGYLISFIIYWVQTHRAKKKLNNTSIKIDSTGEDSIFKDL